MISIISLAMISMNNTTYKAPVVKIVTVHANNLICQSPEYSGIDGVDSFGISNGGYSDD